MECIYLPNFGKKTNSIIVESEEALHLRALRVKIGDAIAITNGSGILAKARVNEILKKGYKLEIYEENENFGELKFRLALAVGILDNRVRFEFCLEKAIELGVTDFIPLLTEFSQKRNFKSDRLIQKSIAAIKQCNRAVLPTIHSPIHLNDLRKFFSQFPFKYLADIDGKSIAHNQDVDTLVVVGPEGGFSNEEINFFEQNNFSKIKLANRRLRSETASLAILTLLTIK